MGFHGSRRNPPAMQEMQVQSLGREDPLEKEMITHSSILAWEIPWTEGPGRLQSIGLQKSQTRLSDWAKWRCRNREQTSVRSVGRSGTERVTRIFLKVFIEFIATMLLFYVLFFGHRHVGSYSFPTRDWTHSPCIGRQSPNYWNTREVPLGFLFIIVHYRLL